MTATRKSNPARTRELARIHVGVKFLQMDRSTYQQFLLTTVGVTSSADLDAEGRRKVIDRMHQLGLPQPPKADGKPKNFSVLAAEVTKIEAQLTDMGLTWSYADAIAQRMHRIARVAWLRKPGQLRAILAALHVEQEKRDSNAFIDRALTLLSMTVEDLEQWFPRLATNWRRKRELLRPIVQRLAVEVSVRDALAGQRKALWEQFGHLFVERRGDAESPRTIHTLRADALVQAGGS